jgi:hypothetical protein
MKTLSKLGAVRLYKNVKNPENWAHRAPEVEDMNGEAGHGVGLAEEAAGVQVRVLRRPASHDLLVKQHLPASPVQDLFLYFSFHKL